MKYAALLLGCLVLITCSALQGMSQWNTRTGTRVPQLVATPLKITTAVIKTRTTKSGKAWISQPLVQVENVSNKPVEYLTIQVTLPNVIDPFMLAYGRQPGKPVDQSIKALQPGQKIDLSVDQHACELMQERLREIDARSLAGNRANTQINGVIFNDQTAWFNGLPHVMEPNNPLVWHVVRNSAATAANNSSTFSFLKVGFRENNNTTICWEIQGTYYVDCCGIQQASLFMTKGVGDLTRVEINTECCQWYDAIECLP